MPNPRKSAVRALVKVDSDGAFSNIILDNVMEQDGLTGADAVLATALFYGVLERRITIDYIADRLSKQPVRKQPYLVAAAIRIGIYQLMFMDRIPPFAAINESVNIVKRSKNSRAVGYVNALLRAVERQKSDLIPTDDSPKSVSVRCSAPLWMVERLSAQYGVEKAVSVFESMLGRSNVYLRVNTTKTDCDSLSRLLASHSVATEFTDVDGSLRIVGHSGAVERLAGYSEGLFHVQDLSSQICAASLDARENMRVLDVCAAPGGKSFTVAEIMNGTGEVVSCDLYEHRVKLISDGAKRLGLGNISARTADASVYDPSLGEFDRVLCDAPCSGLGIMGRKPDIKYKSADQIADLPDIQYNILTNAAKYVRAGGRLVYSTCTLLHEENEDVFERFLSNFPDFCPVSVRTLLPCDDGTDGFFIAAAERKV